MLGMPMRKSGMRAWATKATIFSRRMNDPALAASALSDVWETRTQQEELPNARKMGCSLIIYFRFA